MHLKLFFFTLHIFNLFYPEINKPNIHNNIIDISSFQNGLKDLFSSTGLYLKSKVVGENMFFNFWTPLLKMYIFEVVTFFSCLVVIQSTQFFSVSTFYKIHVFDEPFFLLTIRMLMITKLFRVVTCCKQLSPMYMHGISTGWFCGATWQIKYIDVSIPHSARY